MPMTREMSRGPMPDPVHAPPAVGFDEADRLADELAP